MPALLVAGSVVTELSPDHSALAHRAVHVDVVAVRVGLKCRDESGIGERALGNHTVLDPGGRWQRLHDGSWRTFRSDVDVSGDDVARKVVGDQLEADSAGGLVDDMEVRR